MRSLLSAIGRFLSELRRRKVYQVALAYLVVGFMVIEAADLTLVRLGLPPWTVTFVVVLVGLGFPIALVLAWALEVTPEGVRVDDGGESSEEAGRAPATPSLWVGASVLALVLLGAWWYFGGLSVEEGPADGEGGPPDVEERSIAVLPFSNLGGQKEARPLTRGLHDDLLTRLSNVGDLTVISRTSVEKYRDTDLSLPAIADSLGVRWIVEGGVQKAGERIQVNAQLIDPRTDAHRWAESYDRDLSAKNLFAIQGEIAGKIAEALQATLTAGEQRRIAGAPTQNLDAYRLYVKGRRVLDRATSAEDLRRAATHLQQALAQDSTYALAWAALADAVGQGLYRTYSPEELELPEVSQAEAARRALDLDSDLAEGHAAMGGVYLQQQNVPAALKAFRRAVKLKPSYADAQVRLGRCYFLFLGRPEKALEHLRIAEELTPQHVWARHLLADALLVAGQYEKALTETRRYQRLYPDRWNAVLQEVRFLLYMDRAEEAQKVALEKLPEPTDPRETIWWNAWLISVHAAAGDTARARRHFARLRERKITPYLRGRAHADLGNRDAAFSHLEEIENWTLHPTVELRYETTQGFAALSGDPRYEALLREINEYWGLNPDGSIPDSADVSLPSSPEADA